MFGQLKAEVAYLTVMTDRQSVADYLLFSQSVDNWTDRYLRVSVIRQSVADYLLFSQLD